jgi:hypothetical protein
MHTIEIPEKNRRLYMPENLSQCDSDQYLDMCELLYRYQCGQLPFDSLKVQAVYRLLNLKPTKKELLIPEEEVKWANVARLAELAESFFEDKDGQKVIAIDYTHNPVPKIKPLLKSYYGPQDGFANVTFGEYTDGLRIFLEYSRTGNEALLRELAAIFYRPKKSLHCIKKLSPRYNGDIRQPYNPVSIESRAEAFKYCHPGFAYGFFLYFASFQKYITQAVIPWGGQELDLSILFDGNSTQEPETIPGIGMDAITFSIGESQVFGSKEQVRQVNLWEMLVYLYSLKKKDLDNKQKEKSNAKN